MGQGGGKVPNACHDLTFSPDGNMDMAASMNMPDTIMQVRYALPAADICRRRLARAAGSRGAFLVTSGRRPCIPVDSAGGSELSLRLRSELTLAGLLVEGGRLLTPRKNSGCDGRVACWLVAYACCMVPDPCCLVPDP
mmetsp:Transcript_38272/g.76682  ORF Transcript_38272/g.76682 Transcript_38272/m.76682 type:complete len:138 (-) Transcript_38272:31-444(-)